MADAGPTEPNDKTALSGKPTIVISKNRKVEKEINREEQLILMTIK